MGERKVDASLSVESQIDYGIVDTSDEEELRNDIGNIPHEWYDSYSHFGYSIEGEQVVKDVDDSKIDKFLSNVDGGQSWRTYIDRRSGKRVTLTDEDVRLARTISRGNFPDLNYNPYEDAVHWFSSDIQILPICNAPLVKKSFVPSLHERKRMLRIARALREGRMKPKREKREENSYYLIWDTPQDDSISKIDRWRNHMDLPPTQIKLPTTSESYNPPEEFLPDEEDIKKWDELEEFERVGKYLPHRYKSLLQVPSYDNLVYEKFQRCVDLYDAPRQKRMRVLVEPENLIPKLPSLEELQPFPSWVSNVFKSGTSEICCLSVHHSGIYMASGDSDGWLIVWHISTGRKLFSHRFGDTAISDLAWNPNKDINLILFSCGCDVYLLVPNHFFSDFTLTKTLEVCTSKELSEVPDMCDKWSFYKNEETYGAVVIKHSNLVFKCAWHQIGDYFLTLMLNDLNQVHILVHQLRSRSTQQLFLKPKMGVKDAKFHPTRPMFFILTKTKVVLYHLQKKCVTKNFMTGVRSASSIAVHHEGDNFVVGSNDRKICWFDVDWKTTPYKTFKFNKQEVKDVDIHRFFPLMGAASLDSSCMLLHAKVSSDFNENVNLIPLKKLRSGIQAGVTTVKFHNKQPWLFKGMCDGSIEMYI